MALMQTKTLRWYAEELKLKTGLLKFMAFMFQNAWLYHLTMASGNINQVSTEFERTIAKLKEQDGDTGKKREISISKDTLNYCMVFASPDF